MAGDRRVPEPIPSPRRKSPRQRKIETSQAFKPSTTVRPGISKPRAAGKKEAGWAAACCALARLLLQTVLKVDRGQELPSKKQCAVIVELYGVTWLQQVLEGNAPV